MFNSGYFFNVSFEKLSENFEQSLSFKNGTLKIVKIELPDFNAFWLLKSRKRSFQRGICQKDKILKMLKMKTN